MNLEPMWASEREILRLCARQLNDWASELSASENEKLNAFGAQLWRLSADMTLLHAKSKSQQVPPRELK